MITFRHNGSHDGTLDLAETPRKRKVPGLKTLNRWAMDGVAEATDGCTVEPDGTCEHGKKSWLLVLGLI